MPDGCCVTISPVLAPVNIYLVFDIFPQIFSSYLLGAELS
jgi:hypothetical protein